MGLYELILKHITLAGVLTILGILLKQHKVWVRLTDQMDSLWKDFCIKHDIQFKSLRNGNN